MSPAHALTPRARRDRAPRRRVVAPRRASPLARRRGRSLALSAAGYAALHSRLLAATTRDGHRRAPRDAVAGARRVAGSRARRRCCRSIPALVALRIERDVPVGARR